MHIVTSTDILLPRAEDMGAWSVIACDQFTSEPDYWAAAEERAAEKPSTRPPSESIADSKLSLVRVDGSKNRVAKILCAQAS